VKRIKINSLITPLVLITALSLLWFSSSQQKEEDLATKPAKASTDSSQSDRPKFLPTARGCGYGYVQSYELPDGQKMMEGSVGYPSKLETINEYREWLARASSIIERIPEYENRFGEKGERIVALFPPDAEGKEWAAIFWYDGGCCYTYIQAPTLELALEFEESNAYAY
jgi:hypothetical protein